MATTRWDPVSLGAAVLSVLSNILYIVYFSIYATKRPHFDYQTFKQLDPEFIQVEWQFRNSYRSLELAAGLLGSLYWFFLAIPILQVAWILSNGGKERMGIHVTVALFAIGGSLSECFARLMYIGSTNTTEWLSKDFNLDNWLGTGVDDGIGWRTLEVAHLVVSGIILWIDAFEWFALAVICTLLVVSIRLSNRDDKVSKLSTCFTTGWIRLCVVLAIFSIIDFAAEILRFQSWRVFSTVALFFSAANRLILLPSWLFLMAKQLPLAKRIFDSNNGTVASSENTGAELLDSVKESTRLSTDGAAGDGREVTLGSRVI